MKISLALGVLVSSLPFAFANCKKLEQELPGKVFYEPSSTYKESLLSYFAVQSRVNTRCIFRPESSKDVSKAVKTLAKEKSSKFAIRSGGHNPNRGFSSILDGVTFDLRSFNDVSLSKDKKLAHVSSGAVWGDVYPLTDAAGVAVIGGRGGKVGTAGFITGGGISAFSRRRGWGFDNVANFEIVLASGDIVNANAKENQDLFQALKGGQNNFGVVTRFDLITFPQKPFLGGAIFYPRAANDATFEAFYEYMNRSSYDPDELAELGYSYTASDKSFSTLLNTFHSGGNPNGLARWQAIQPQTSSTVRVSNISDFSTEIDELQAPNKFVQYATSAVAISPTILKKSIHLWEVATNDTWTKIPGTNSAIIIQPTPPVPKGLPNSFGFPKDAKPEADLVLLLFANSWDKDSDSNVIQDRTYKLIDEINAAAAKEGVKNDFRYLNYAAIRQKPFQSWGRESEAFLKRVAKRYDPEGVFQKQVPGGFKLF